jgi:cyclopropane fatty-acyl-phospholipid synthase-like methyltransferase
MFLEADYLQLPLLDPVDLVFSIEAFVHASDVGRFFEQAATVLKAGGRVIFCDDFLAKMGTSATLLSQHTLWLQEFRRGWHTAGLLSLQHMRADAVPLPMYAFR